MNELTSFEKEIKQTYHLPEIDPDFFDQLGAKLQTYPLHPQKRVRPALHFSRGWVYVMSILLVVAALVIALGPAKVLAQIQAVFGFIPGVGLADTTSSFRQLTEPVSDTRDGITLTIQSAFLSADQTIIHYTISDLPMEMKRARFGDPECNSPVYLILPDGSKIEAARGGSSVAPDGSQARSLRFEGSFSDDFYQADLVFPCLEGSAPGKGPQNWQIALNFEPTTQESVVYPATLVPLQANTPELTPTGIDSAVQPEVETEVPAMPAKIIDGERQEEMVVLSVIENPDSYWVTWAYPDQFDRDIHGNGQLYIVPFNPVLYDANGTELPVPDQATQNELWQYQDSLQDHLSDQDGLMYSGTMHTFVVPRSGIAFPVYAKQNVYERSFPEKEVSAEIKFDGSSVQSSDEPLEINQEIQLGSVKFKLEAIMKDQYGYGGYAFLFDGIEGKVVQCRIELAGYEANVTGDSSFNLDDPFHFKPALLYQQIPTGKLTLRVSQPAVLGDLVSFIGSWSPDQ